MPTGTQFGCSVQFCEYIRLVNPATTNKEKLFKPTHTQTIIKFGKTGISKLCNTNVLL